MPGPSAIELYGDPRPIPLDQLQNDEKIKEELAGKGKLFECEEKLIDNRLQTVFKNLPTSTRDLWKSCSQVRIIPLINEKRLFMLIRLGLAVIWASRIHCVSR